MEEFYSLLIRPYKQALSQTQEPRPDRILAYHDPELPAYWNVLASELTRYDCDSTIFEIGSGFGDVLALTHFLGFKNARGMEMDEHLVQIANQKLRSLFGFNEGVMLGRYPTSIPSPDILLQINCVYFEGMSTKEEFLNQLVSFYQAASPRHYIVEVIDDSFRQPSQVFPPFVRLSEEDMQHAFQGLRIRSVLTYQFPANTSTKRLYIISQ